MSDTKNTTKGLQIESFKDLPELPKLPKAAEAGEIVHLDVPDECAQDLPDASGKSTCHSK